MPGNDMPAAVIAATMRNPAQYERQSVQHADRAMWTGQYGPGNTDRSRIVQARFARPPSTHPVHPVHRHPGPSGLSAPQPSPAATMGAMSTAPRSEAAKRDWGHDETGCTVLHVDMDAFYASCEVARRPELKGVPLIIGTGARSVVSAASYEARRFGVNSAMPVARARQLCPNGVFLPVDMAYYRSVSREIFALMEQVTDRIERTSVDEGYMDVRGALLRWDRPTAIGAWIRSEVSRRFHVTCSVGVASNKMVAKIASTNAKPDGMLLIPVARQAEFVQMLPLRSIPGIGPAAGRRFADWGVSSVADLAQLTEAQIAQITGSPAGAHALWLAARGESDHVVTPHTPEKSIGSERTLAEDTDDWRDVATLMRRAGDEVASSLRRKGLMAHTLSVKLRFADLSYATRTRALDEATDLASAIVPQALALTRALLNMGERDVFTPCKIRLAGLSVSGLIDRATTAIQPSLETLLEEEEAGARSSRPHQQTVSSDEATDAATDGATVQPHPTTRRRQAEQALDSIRSRYGKGAAKLGL